MIRITAGWMIFESGISGMFGNYFGNLGKVCALWAQFFIFDVTGQWFASISLAMIVSPLHPLCGSFPRWGTLDEIAGSV